MRRFGDVNYYTALGVATTASRDEIRSAYRDMVRGAHPDLGGDPEQFALISEAWEVLGNQAERDYYDADRKLRARAARRYAPTIDRDPRTGTWTTQPSTDEGDDPANGAAAARADDGLTDAQRWMRNKRRL